MNTAAPMTNEEVRAALESYLAQRGAAFADVRIGNARFIVIPNQHILIYAHLPSYAEWQAELVDGDTVGKIVRVK